MPIPREKGETKDEWMGKCIGIEINNGKDPSQAAAICYAKWEEFGATASTDLPPANIEFESYSDYPDSVKNNAKAVLDWTEKNGWGSCGTGVGKARANQLANGEPISVDTIQRMYSYLSRHEVDLERSKSYSDGCGKLMYDSWGGLSAKSWAHNKLKQLGKIDMAADPACPIATQDIPTNLKNRQKAIDVAHYGPLDPNLPNEDYWIAKAKMFNDSPENAKKARCANCSFFNQTKKILDCIANGIGSETDPYQTIKAGDLGYCEAFDFKCASLRTCDAWVAGGPITDSSPSTNMAKIVKLSKVSFDYDDTLSTAKGKEMAKRAIERGDTVYIISARGDRSGLLNVADELGIPYSRVYATGSNKAKEEKVKELGIDKHIDNNALVVRALPGVGQKFKAKRKVIFNEDFNEETVIEYINRGFSVHIRSARKIQRRDKKVWNKLRAVGLTEDVMVFGEVKDLDKRYGYDLLMTGQDPVLERLKLMGEDASKYKVLNSKRINSIQEAFAAEAELMKSVDLKFVTVKVKYTYEEIEGVPAAKSGSRPFCSHLMSTRRMYSLEEIASLSTTHLSDMGLPEDVFQYRGGFYHNPETNVTTPTCRHYWKANVVVG